jgi:hypothetical protein
MAAGFLKMRYKVSPPVRTVVSLRRPDMVTISARASRKLSRSMEIPPSTAIGYAEARLRSKRDNRSSTYVAALNRNVDYAVRG